MDLEHPAASLPCARLSCPLRFSNTGGVLLTYEAVRSWYRSFAQAHANQLRRRRPKLSDK
jgi:hypothetical protein